MATQNKNLSLFDKTDIPSAKGMHFGIVVANWNSKITSHLLDGSKEALLECGASASNISVMEVPGSFELVFGTKLMSKQKVEITCTHCDTDFELTWSEEHPLTPFTCPFCGCEIDYDEQEELNRD